MDNESVTCPYCNVPMGPAVAAPFPDPNRRALATCPQCGTTAYEYPTPALDELDAMRSELAQAKQRAAGWRLRAAQAEAELAAMREELEQPQSRSVTVSERKPIDDAVARCNLMSRGDEDEWTLDEADRVAIQLVLEDRGHAHDRAETCETRLSVTQSRWNEEARLRQEAERDVVANHEDIERLTRELEAVSKRADDAERKLRVCMTARAVRAETAERERDALRADLAAAKQDREGWRLRAAEAERERDELRERAQPLVEAKDIAMRLAISYRCERDALAAAVYRNATQAYGMDHEGAVTATQLAAAAWSKQEHAAERDRVASAVFPIRTAAPPAESPPATEGGQP